MAGKQLVVTAAEQFDGRDPSRRQFLRSAEIPRMCDHPQLGLSYPGQITREDVRCNSWNEHEKIAAGEVRVLIDDRWLVTLKVRIAPGRVLRGVGSRVAAVAIADRIHDISCQAPRVPGFCS